MDFELLNVQKAAKLLSLSPKTIRKWAQLRKIKGVKIGTRGDWRFLREDVLSVLNNGTGALKGG